MGSKDGPLKIGMANNPAARLRSIQTGSPQPIRLLRHFAVETEQARRVERRTHLGLLDHRLAGEWFEISLDQAVAAVEQAMAEPAEAKAAPFEMVLAITPATCRAARGLLDWSQQDLAEKSGVGITAVRTFERGKSTPMAQNLAALTRALEADGVEFIAENGGGAGVRLRNETSGA